MKTAPLCLSLLALTAPALAQKPLIASSARAKSPLDVRLDLTTPAAGLETTLRNVCKTAGVSLEVRGALPSAPVSLLVKKMRAESVLTGLAHLYQFGLRIENRGAKTLVLVGKGLPVPAAPSGGSDDNSASMSLLPTPDPARTKAWMDLIVNVKGGLKTLGDPATATLPLRILLGEVDASQLGRKYPQTRVSVDTTKAFDVKRALIVALKESGHSFAVEEDVPDDVFNVLALERVPLSVALDVLCKALGVGWIAEAVDGEVLVRVGKKYVGASE